MQFPELHNDFAKLVYNSQKEDKKIFFNMKEKKFFLSEREVALTHRFVQELSLQDIIDLSRLVDTHKMKTKNITRLYVSLNEIADKTEKKHFTGFGAAFLKLLNKISNALAGRGFQTTVSEAREAANELIKKKLSQESISDIPGSSSKTN